MSADGELPGMWEESDLSGGWADTDGESARDRLYEALSKGAKHAQIRQHLIDAFAHELAEKVMALRANLPDLAARPAWKAGYDAALVMAALTIDPMKESNRG